MNHRMASIGPLTGLLPLLICALSGSGQAAAAAFQSPSGQFSASFTEVKRHQGTWKDNIDNVSHVKYSVAFTRKADNVTMKTDFTDVYGWSEDAAPTDLSSIFKAVIWSPGEDFVILPEEQWAGAPSSPYRKAVSLNRELNWSTSTVHMGIMAWAGDFKVFGNVTDDCDYHVAVFDGRTGATKMLRESRIPVGYQIESVSGSKLFIKKVLDNCRTGEDEKQFTPQCEILDMESLGSEPVVCPQ